MSPWIRYNAQLDLRENLRAAIRKGGYTQARAANLSGIPMSRLGNRLNGASWFAREEVEALSELLGIPVVDLLGGSIFRNDPKEAEFDFCPARLSRDIGDGRQGQMKPSESSDDRERAICCVCGILRFWASKLHGTTFIDDLQPEERMVEDLSCDNCGKPTRHALLRRDHLRNAAEEQDHAPLAAAQALHKRDELIERMRGFNVAVEFRVLAALKNHKTPPTLMYEYDESRSQWLFEVNSAAPVRVQLETLQDNWQEVASGKFTNDITWDPAGGVAVFGSSDAWTEATDELMTDLARFLTVERRRMVLEINRDIARAQFSVSEREQR